MTIECRKCKKEYEIFDTIYNVNSASECPNCGFENKGCINCKGHINLEGPYDGFLALSGIPKVVKSINSDGNVNITEIPIKNIVGKTDFYVCKNCIDDELFKVIPGLIFFCIVGIIFTGSSILSFINNFNIFISLFMLIIGVGFFYMLTGGIVSFHASLINKGNGRKDCAFDIAKKHNIVSTETVKIVKNDNYEKEEQKKSINKKINEVDIIKKDAWVCGRCQTINNIDLDYCKNCGKEFNPPL